MSKKIFKAFLIIAVFALSIFTVYAVFDPADPASAIHVVKEGETEHATVTMEYDDNADFGPGSHLVCDSHVYGRVRLSADPGYYVSNLSVKFNDQNLQLGFIAASAHGTSFREYVYSPHENEYMFCIPNDADSSNKVEVKATIAEKAPLYISYNVGNSGALVVEEYQDGDIILPNGCTDNGCNLKITFDNQADYEAYSATKMSSNPDENEPWFNADASDGAIRPGECVNNDTDGYYCTVEVGSNFKDAKVGFLDIGYTRLKLYAPGYLGLNLVTDVPNFNDLLDETGGGLIDFTDDRTTKDVQIFYGTQRIEISVATPAALVTDGGAVNMGGVRSINEITGSGYGYDVEQISPTSWAINFNSFYQDEMPVKLNLRNNGTDLFENGVTLNFHRLAFAGNAGALLEVDADGKNCNEPTLDPHCENGVYYSTQYRGVMKFNYIDTGVSPDTLNNLAGIVDISDDTITLADDGSITTYKRNTAFNPHAIALFYDANDEIVKVEDFDLNKIVLKEGFVRVDRFNELLNAGEFYEGKTLSGYSLTGKSHVNTGRYMVPIENDDYFGPELNDVIMHDLVLISKDEVRDLGIKKIGLFLVNGEIEKGSIPELTYGIGEGKILEIRDGD